MKVLQSTVRYRGPFAGAAPHSFSWCPGSLAPIVDFTSAGSLVLGWMWDSASDWINGENVTAFRPISRLLSIFDHELEKKGKAGVF